MHGAAKITYAKINPLDIVLLCGSPGSGKSTFYWRHLKPLGYARVNQDLLKRVRWFTQTHVCPSCTVLDFQ